MTDVLDPRTPVLVGAAQFTQRTTSDGRIDESLNPIEMLVKAGRGAMADAGAALEGVVDTVAVVRFAGDTPDEQDRASKRIFRNPPAALAARLNLQPRRNLYTAGGGNAPQWLVNRVAEEIANGECEVALLAGAECLATLVAAAKDGIDLGWANTVDADPGSDPQEIGEARAPVNATERVHGLHLPVNTYPLFENAIRGQVGRNVQDHLARMGQLFSPFSKLASENPLAWFPTYHSPDEISTPTPQNRFVGFPYTKYLNAMMDVDMSAAVVMMSVGRARELGVPQSKWVFLHGCADANDIWNVSERVNYYSSSAIRIVGQKAFAMANKAVADLSFIDLYSCFPSAVELACAELGIAEDDPCGLTITGGMPYFGGPGNNYTMHAIATTMDRLRARPGTFGLCTGNGWFLTKYSAGLYSTAPVAGKWRREDPSTYQKEIDAMARPEVEEAPEGKATVETYTVVITRDGKRAGLVVGRLEDGHRFLAQTPDDEAILNWMMREEMLGRVGDVAPTTTANLFRFR